MPAEDKKWQIESDARTLKEAAMIHADPKRHEAAMAMMTKEMDAMKQMEESMKDPEGKAKKRFPGTYKEE